MGDEEEAVAAIRKLRSTGPSADDLAKTVDERLTFRDAFSRFQDEYKDIVSNPHLNKLAIDRDVELVRAGDTRSYWERYQSIGEEIRGVVKNIAETSGYAKPTEEDKAKQESQKNMQNRQERKEGARSAPTSAGAKTSNTQADEKEETVSDVISNMAKSRGGPQWMHGFQG